jgi:hypothetical protein
MSNGHLFVRAVERGLLKWQDSEGLEIIHDPYGPGRIVSVDVRTNGLYLYVQFSILPTDEAKKRFNKELFTSIALRELMLPPLLADNPALCLQLAQESRSTEKHEGSNKLTYQEELASLIAKYLRGTAVAQARDNRLLYMVLKVFEEGLYIDDEAMVNAIEALGEVHPSIAAKCYEVQARLSGQRWRLTKACHWWRRAKQPGKVLQLTTPQPGDTRYLQAVLYTCRAAALKDLGYLEEARRVANIAEDLNDASAPHPYLVQSAIHHQLGQFSEAQTYRRLAQLCGAWIPDE